MRSRNNVFRRRIRLNYITKLQSFFPLLTFRRKLLFCLNAWDTQPKLGYCCMHSFYAYSLVSSFLFKPMLRLRPRVRLSRTCLPRKVKVSLLGWESVPRSLYFSSSYVSRFNTWCRLWLLRSSSVFVSKPTPMRHNIGLGTRPPCTNHQS